MSKENDKSRYKLLSKEALQNLAAREAKALKGKFGIELNNSVNLDEFGKGFGVIREQIQKIERKALRKLRDRSDDGPSPA